MKRHYYVHKGRVTTIVKLSQQEQAILRKKNINILLEQAFYRRVFEDTVSFADRRT